MTHTTFSHQKPNSPEARYTDDGLRSFFVYRDTGVTPATLVNEPDSQVDLDDNGEPIPEAAGASKPGLKKVEDDAVVKKLDETIKQ